MANEYKGLVDITTGLEITDANANGVLSLTTYQINQIGKQRNAIIGGDFGVNPWQRGTTFTNVAPDDVTADGIRHTHSSATLAYDVSKDADAPTIAEAGILSESSIKLIVTTADATVDATDTWHMISNIEGYWFKNLAQKVITQSFWVKSNVTGTYCIALRNSGLDQSIVNEYTINVADTWERKTITFSASPSAGTWDYTDGYGIRLSFVLAAGVNAQTGTPSLWTATDDIATSNQVNLMGTIGNYIKFNFSQLEPGTIATQFEDRSIQEELLWCERYYEKSFNQGVDPVQNSGTDRGVLDYRATDVGVFTHTVIRAYHSTKRTAPTLTFFSPFDASSNWWNTSTNAISGAPTDTQASLNQIVIRNPQVAADAPENRIILHWTSDASL